jgi:inosine-uridine nucleoside N-ribohydrolase
LDRDAGDPRDPRPGPADGAAAGLTRHAERIHGDLLDLPPASHGATLRPGNAVDWLIETYLASDGEIVLCPVGPLTNIAVAIVKEPRILEKIPEIVIMGGAHHEGNQTASAEFNFWLDPEAARVVVECGRPIRMVPLDATHRARVSAETRAAAPRTSGRRPERPPPSSSGSGSTATRRRSR